MVERFFAPCPRGLEAVLAAELARLGLADIEAADGGVAFSGPFESTYQTNLESRIASRILWRVGGGEYRNERDVNAIAASIDWSRYFAPSRTLRVDVAATRSPLKSLEFATLTIKDAVCDRMRADKGIRPSIDKRAPDVRVHAYLTANEATLYLDTSGEPLFKRGYRKGAEDAPLKENLAAGLLAHTSWPADAVLLDPMCGSGTLAIEAAAIAADRAPGLKRSFGFQKLARYDGPSWQRTRQAALDRVRAAPASPAIHASDASAEAVAKTVAHLREAGLADHVRVERADVLTRPAPASVGTLIANPPYGVRLAELDELVRFYPKLGDALKQRFAGWTAFIFTADLRAPKLIGLKASRRVPLYNGALESRLLEYRIVSGSMRG